MKGKEFKHAFDELGNAAEYVKQKLREDPFFASVIMYRLLEERENTNRLLKTLIQRLERIEAKLEGKSKEEKELILSEIDEKILEIVKELGKVTARDVAKRLGYRGANGASARLNRLYEAGLLKKKRAGKKVMFFLAR